MADFSNFWNDKVVAISGCNRPNGIGFSLAKDIVSKGGKIVGIVRCSSNELNNIAFCVIDEIDNSSDDCGDKVVSKLNEKGITKIDVLIANSGLLEYKNQKIVSKEQGDRLDIDRMRSMFEINTLGPLKLSEALFRSDHLQSGSSVFFMSSLMGSIGDASGGVVGYRMSKAALNMVAKVLSNDFKSKGISVQSLHPGYVNTDMTSKFPGGQDASTSAACLIDVMQKITMDTTGKFLSYEGGKEEPW